MHLINNNKVQIMNYNLGASRRTSQRFSLFKDMSLCREIEKVLKNLDGPIDIYELLSNSSKSYSLNIVPTLLKLPNTDPIFLTTVKGIIKTEKKK